MTLVSRSVAGGCRATPAALALLASVGCGNAGNGAAPLDAGGAAPDAPGSALTSDSGPGPGPDSGGAEAAAVVVHPCSALGAAGVWENITPPQFLQIPGASAVDGGTNNTPIAQAVAVNPQDQSVFLSGFTWAGRSTGLLRSTDCGATWTKVSTGRNGAALDTGAQWAMHIDPAAPDTIYVVNGYGSPGTLLKSTNGGVDWDDLFPAGSNVNTNVEYGGFTQALGLDPGDPKHLVVTFHANCKNQYAPMCLGESKDAGATWRLFKGPAEATGWAEAASVTVLGSDSYLFVTPADNGAFYTGDGGQTWAHVVTGPAYSTYSGGTYLTADGTLYLGVANTGIFYSRAVASSPLGKAWTLIPKSPQASVVIGDGVSLYAAWGWDTGGKPFYSSPAADAGTWTHLDSPAIAGPGYLDYDAAHHIVYAPAGDSVWRMVTR
jgi:photosystem II stability/assembly factor-like uncharacterized protein